MKPEPEPESGSKPQSESGSEPEVVLEGTTASIRSDTQVSSPARLRWVLLGLVGLMAVVLGLSQWQRGEPAPPRTDEDAAESEEPDEEEDEDEDGDPEESEDEDNTSAEDEQSADDEDDRDPASEHDDDGGVATTAGSGPVVGEETGLALIMINESSEEIQLLDLDTGTEYELAVRGPVIGVLDGHVVIQESGPGSVSAVPLDSQDGSEIVLASSNGGWVDGYSVGEGVVWVLRQQNASPGETAEMSLQAYDLSGNLVDERPMDRSGLFFGQMSTDDLIWETGGGTYRQLDDGFERLSIGALMATGDDLALVRECDDRRDCDYHWYRKTDWEGPLDLPPPSVGSTTSWLGLRGNDRWLIEQDWLTETINVIDVTTGQVIREAANNFQNTPAAAFGLFSPDGRWLMDDDASGILLVDLDTGAEFSYESDFARPAATLSGVFVDRDQVGFLP